jgi:hypothetical protein
MPAKSQRYRLLNNEVYAGWIVKFGERHKGVFVPLISAPVPTLGIMMKPLNTAFPLGAKCYVPLAT